MTRHVIEPTTATLHGSFSPDFAPALTIDPGDTVVYRTLDAGWGLEPHVAPGVPRKKFTPRVPERDAGHALCGPVAIRGAQPGMTLAVRIDAVVPGAWGWSAGGGWATDLNTQLGLADGDEWLMIWQLDAAAGGGVNQYGHRVALRPFLGIIGMPPPEAGWHSTVPPRPWGGNLDCKELVAGSTLYLPIPVPGALVSAGDGHAVQGDGEVGQVALECPMERVELTYSLRDDLPLTLPQADTPAGWITFGLDADLNVAMVQALAGMLDVIMARYNVPRKEALALASLVVDLRITQVVNEVRGVHAVLPPDAIR